MTTLTINEKTHDVDADPNTPLLWVLREWVGMTGTKYGTTIEGLASNGNLHPVQKAWLEHDVPQCGYCQSGMIMAVVALLKEKAKPSDADINSAVTNICRCGTFQQVRAAIHAAANA
jgi:isoquinoline 1-oxidoreductase alpha subunit